MERLKNCRYCGKKMPRNGNKMYYCSDWCRQHWHLFYVPGIKQAKCMVCGKELLGRQLKYCSKSCYGKGRYRRRKMITEEMVKMVKKVQ